MQIDFNPSWPEGFDFYEYGSIEPSLVQVDYPLDQIAEGKVALGVRLFDFDTDHTRVLLLLVDRGTDLSMYLEIANILAARMAEKDEFLIAAPQMVGEETLRSTLKGARHYSVCEYVHRASGHERALISVVIEGPAVEAGNA